MLIPPVEIRCFASASANNNLIPAYSLALHNCLAGEHLSGGIKESMAESQTMESEPEWYCLRAKPKREHIAAASLRKLDQVDVYCPRIRYKKATRRGAVWFAEALFPGYLFARFDYLRSHLAVRHANGVSAILHFGQRVPTVDNGLIESLRELYVGADNDIKVINPEITPGSVVTVASGVFAGLETLVTRVLPAKKRVCILLTFLGQEQEAQIPYDQVVLPKHSIRSDGGVL